MCPGLYQRQDFILYCLWGLNVGWYSVYEVICKLSLAGKKYEVFPENGRFFLFSTQYARIFPTHNSSHRFLGLSVLIRPLFVIYPVIVATWNKSLSGLVLRQDILTFSSVPLEPVLVLPLLCLWYHRSPCSSPSSPSPSPPVWLHQSSGNFLFSISRFSSNLHPHPGVQGVLCDAQGLPCSPNQALHSLECHSRLNIFISPIKPLLKQKQLFHLSHYNFLHWNIIEKAQKYHIYMNIWE